MLSRLLYGGRITLVAGLAAPLISTGFGVLLGLVAGYFSGWADIAVMRLLDVLLRFLLAILIVAFHGRSTLHGLIAIAVANLPFFARRVRGQTLQLRERTFVEAARALGSATSAFSAATCWATCCPWWSRPSSSTWAG